MQSYWKTLTSASKSSNWNSSKNKNRQFSSSNRYLDGSLPPYFAASLPASCAALLWKSSRWWTSLTRLPSLAPSWNTSARTISSKARRVRKREKRIIVWSAWASLNRMMRLLCWTARKDTFSTLLALRGGSKLKREKRRTHARYAAKRSKLTRQTTYDFP